MECSFPDKSPPGKIIRIGVLSLLLFFLFPISSLQAASQDRIVFGEQQFTRIGGSTDIYQESFSVPASVGDPFTLHIVNGNPDGSQRVAIEDAVSSGRVFVDGVEVVSPNEFSQTVAVIDKTLSLGPGNHTLEVHLNSAPDSYIKITISGVIALGDLNQGRSGHTATLLPDGKVLITGGDGSTSILASVEVFDPGTLSASVHPNSLDTARTEHTATLLPDTQGLLVAGKDPQGTSFTAELFDPASGTFQSLANTLQNLRSGHTATQLEDGRVLIVGGADGGSLAQGSTEAFDPRAVDLFDPQTGTFSSLPNGLNTPRVNHTATLLADGQVLIVGGKNGTSALGSAEVYDPSTGTFTPLANVLNTAREGHTATLLPDGTVLIAGGRDSTGVLASAEIYDPVTQSFAPSTKGLIVGRADHTATLLPIGEVLIAGGDDGSGPVNHTELFGPPAEDTVSPVVLSVNPPGNATKVYLNEIVSIRFSEPVNVNTIVSSTLTLSDPVGSVTGKVSPSESGLLAFFVPDAHLNPGEPYTIDLSGTVTDLAGNPLTAFSSVFTAYPLPTITNFTPTSGPEGTAVTITGTDFDPVIGNNTVKFNGVISVISSATETSIETSVPAGAATGPITVTTPGGTATSATDFTVITGPTITSFSPASGPFGRPVTITGQNFEAMASDNQVDFNGTPAVITSATATQITTTVPMDSSTGPITVTTTQGSESSADPFTVTLSKDFSLEASPVNPSLVAGSYRFISIGASPIDDFTDLIGLHTDPLPSGLSMLFLPSQISPGELSTVKIIADATASPGTYPVTVHGTAQIDGQTITRDVILSVEILPPGTTTLTGQVRSTEGVPLEGVFVTLGNSNDTTDAGGNFLLSNVPTGHQMILIDGRTAIAPGEFYPEVVVSVDITGGQGNVMPYLVYLPKLDIDHPINLPIDASGTTTQEVIATTPKIPDLEVRIPAGTQIIDPAGNPVSQITITAVPPDRSPMPFPANAEGAQIFTIQPGGSTLSQPVPITFPNNLNGDPGERADFYYFDVTSGSWNLYGQGTVSPDARQVVPDPGVGIPIFAWHFTALQLVQDQTPFEQTVEVNDPVDVTTGLLMVEKTDMVLPGRIPIALTRTYHQARTTIGDFGIGTSHNYDMQLLPNAGGESLVLVQGDDKRFRFTLESGNTFVSINSPAMRGATATLNPDNSGTVRLKDGTVFTFDTTGRLIGQQDRNGNQLTIDRDSSGNIISVEVPQGGGYLEFGYDGSNRITSITDSLLRQVTYSYIAQGRLETVTDPAGGQTIYTYDTQGRLETITDARGITYLQNEYDANGRVIKQTNADGGIFEYQYFGPNGRALLSGPTNDTGEPTGGCGGRTEVVQPGDPIPPGALCVVQVVVPSPANFLVSQAIVIDPEGNAESYRFNSAGFLIEQTDPLGHTTKFDREIGTNRLLSTTDALGRKTTFTYDERENVTSITDPQQNVTQFTYEPTFNRLTSITDTLNQTTTFEYDANGNLTKTIDPLFNETTITYNSFGQPETVTDPLLNTTQFEYDAQGNLKATIDPLGNRAIRVYDAVSRLIALTDPLGNTTKFQYDDVNRVEQITDAKNGITGFTYDGNGNLLTVTDANNHTTTYTYDIQDRLETRADPLSRQESYTYDLNGNLKTFTDRKLQVSTFDYDPLDRRIVSQYDDGSTTSFTYDTSGRLKIAEDSVSGRIEFSYDNLDRLVQELTAQGTVEYQYDAIGQRTNMTVNGQTPVSYQYDSNSRLTQVAQGTQVVGLGYDAAGRRTSLSYPNGVETAYVYDQSSRLLEIEHLNISTQQLIERLNYTYDAAGNRISFTRANGTATLLPDSVQAAYDAANEQIQFDSATSNLTYDSNGNLTSQTDATGTTTYTWDARNRLLGINGPGVIASFVYDVLGRRFNKTINGTTTFYLYDNKDIVQEMDNFSVTVNYLRSLNIDQPLVRQSFDFEYYHSGTLGSVFVLTNESGVPETTYQYDPFGNTIVLGSSTNPFQYTGRENDQTGFYFYRARYYNPKLSRFISEDPIEFLGGNTNLYGYANNNPVNSIDPEGLCVPVTPDVIIDAGFILYDLYRLAIDGRKGLGENLAALSADVGGLCTPAVTGLGLGIRLANSGADAWKTIKASRPLNKMGHAQKHFKDFQKLDPRLTEGDVAKILEFVRKTGKQTAGPFGRKNYEAPVQIGGNIIKVKVVEKSSGNILTGFPRGP